MLPRRLAAGLPWLLCAWAVVATAGQDASSSDVPVRQPFSEWLEGVRTEALARGIRAATLDSALTGLEPLPVVVERDRAQAEYTFTLDGYIRRRLTPRMV